MNDDIENIFKIMFNPRVTPSTRTLQRHPKATFLQSCP